MTFPPRLVLALTLPVAMTTVVGARGTQPPVPKSDIILRDPKASDHAVNRKLNLEAGVYVNSEAYLPDRGTQTNRDLYILRATQGVEGGFDSVNIYDRGVLSWGVMQWAAHENSLQDVLAYVKGRLLDKNRGRVWAALFKEHGLDIQTGPDGQPAFFVGGPTAWRPVTGITNLRVLFRGTRTVGKYDPSTAAKWAQVFARAGRNPQVQALQTEWAVRNVRRCLSEHVDGDLTASDFTRGDTFSDALLFALWTNNPAASRTHFARAVRETRRITGEASPSRWPQGLFPFVWERVGRTSRFGAWPKRTAQIAASVPVGDGGRRAAKAHLALLGWKPERVGTGTGTGQLWKRPVYVAARPAPARSPRMSVIAASAPGPVRRAPDSPAVHAKAFAAGAIRLPRTAAATPPSLPTGRDAVYVRAYGSIPLVPKPVVKAKPAKAFAAKVAIVANSKPARLAPSGLAAFKSVASPTAMGSKTAPPVAPVSPVLRDRTAAASSSATLPAPSAAPMSPISVIAVRPSDPFVIVINKPAPGDAVPPVAAAKPPIGVKAAPVAPLLAPSPLPVTAKPDEVVKPALTRAAPTVNPQPVPPASQNEPAKNDTVKPGAFALPSTAPRVVEPLAIPQPTSTAAKSATVITETRTVTPAPAAPQPTSAPPIPPFLRPVPPAIERGGSGGVVTPKPRPATTVAPKPALPKPRPAAIVPSVKRSGGVLSNSSTLSFTGFGAVRLGMTRAAAEAAARDTLIPVVVPAALAPVVGGATGDGLYKPQHGPRGVQFVVENGVIARINFLPGCDAQTASGARVGDTAAALRDRYPDALLSSAPSGGGRVFTVRSERSDRAGRVFTLRPRAAALAASRMTFETNGNGRIVAIRADRVRKP